MRQVIRATAGFVRLSAAMLPLLLGACAGNLQYTRLDEAGLPPAHELAETPFYPQQLHHCGPSALATALTAAGRTIHPEELAQLVYLPERKGSLAVELAAAVRHLGYLPYRLRPRLADLLAEIAHGRPVVVLQNLGLQWLPRWHYAVAIGYDLPAGKVILRSGVHRRVLTDIATFERTWRRGDYWALLALPPGQLPARAETVPYLEAAVGLERIHPRAARKSYLAAVERWPEHLTAWMGLGNNAYLAGDRDAAADAYRAALLLDPDYAPALNNLAQTLADLGKREEAERLARRAIDIGGDRVEDYRATLQDILRNTTP